MRDDNENNIDDQIEQLGYLAGISHFRGQQKNLDESAKQSEYLRRLNDFNERAARKAERARKTEEARIKSLPQCPLCGGRLEGQFQKCSHCASDLSWIEGRPCEFGKEQELLAMLDNLRLETAKTQSEIDLLTDGFPQSCPQCHNPRPSLSLSEYSGSQILLDVRTWIESVSLYGCCATCRNSFARIEDTSISKQHQERTRERHRGNLMFVALGYALVTVLFGSVILLFFWLAHSMNSEPLLSPR